MPTVNVPAHLSVHHLVSAIKQLTPAEWCEFMKQLTAWRQQHGPLSDQEATLLRRIEQNSGLPLAEQRRFNRLRRKAQSATLTTAETETLQAFWQQVERMNVVRLDALIQLTRLRHTDVRTCMRDVGLTVLPDAF